MVGAVSAQSLSATLAVAKPVVDKWDAEYKAGNRTTAVRDHVVAEIQEFLAQHTADVWAYEAAALGYNHLSRNADAVAVMREYLHRFPTEEALDDRVLFFLGIAGTKEDVDGLPARWRNQPMYWSTALTVYVRAHVAPELLVQPGKEIIRRTPIASDNGGEVRYRVAETWLANGVDPRIVETAAREAVGIAEVGPRPDWQFRNEFERRMQDRLLVRNLNRSVLGWSLYRQGRFDEALAEFERAAAIVEKDSIPTSGLYYRMGRTLEKLDRVPDAIQTYYKELAWGSQHEETGVALSAAYQKIHGSLDGLEDEKRMRVNDLATLLAKQESDLTLTVDVDLGRFDLADAGGAPVDLSRFKGKVVLIDFWATWCHACLAGMKHTDALQHEYSDRIVVVAPSLDPEEKHAQAVEYLRKMGYHFTLVFDDPKRRAITLPFIPVRLLLDTTGRLKFMQFGSTTEGDILFETKLRALLGVTGPK
jgi:thiol-disulfide isomerase/thioredoxin